MKYHHAQYDIENIVSVWRSFHILVALLLQSFNGTDGAGCRVGSCMGSGAWRRWIDTQGSFCILMGRSTVLGHTL